MVDKKFIVRCEYVTKHDFEVKADTPEEAVEKATEYVGRVGHLVGVEAKPENCVFYTL